VMSCLGLRDRQYWFYNI